ncbi:MAG TPA: lanthionine synthetase LanC family protein [Thermoanaerobaculia bacterium]|nr:lanthionine synthetase LanC family protein [Thermoanaerobaculia bacterium]
MTTLPQTYDTRITDGELVTAALRIARRIGEAAFWSADGTQCNWLGRGDEDGTSEATQTPVNIALGAHLYSGTLGIALFLGEVWRLTGDAEVARVARAAIRRSLTVLDKTIDIPVSPVSFWAGHTGAAWAFKRFADIGLDPGARGEVPRLLARVREALREEHVLDIIGGNAGAVPALVVLAREPEWRAECLSIARALVDEIAVKARRDESHAAWDPKPASGFDTQCPPMTGFSHGASGIALAAMELYGATGEARDLELARAGFQYEDALFNPHVGNWPDMRSGGASYQAAWCHGAPGMAMARARARQLDPARATHYEAYARAGARTTSETIARYLQAPRYDTSMCHGIGGLSEVLLTIGELLGDTVMTETSRNVAAELIARYGETADYPTGAPMRGPNPSLFIGWAGTGYHFVRLASDAPRIAVIA